MNSETNTSFIVVGYYTRDTFYEDLAAKFIESMDQFCVPHYVEAIDNLGDWHLNTSYKPTFLIKMLDKFPNKNIIYVDVDAKFFAYPKLFLTLNCEIGVHYFDRSQHKNPKAKGFEVLSGTVFLKNCDSVKSILERWESECKRRPYIWDQKSLERVLEGNFYHLPANYCIIFDIMSHVKQPVIVHYQASREVRKNHGKLRRA